MRTTGYPSELSVVRAPKPSCVPNIPFFCLSRCARCTGDEQPVTDPLCKKTLWRRWGWKESLETCLALAFSPRTTGLRWRRSSSSCARPCESHRVLPVPPIEKLAGTTLRTSARLLECSVLARAEHGESPAMQRPCSARVLLGGYIRRVFQSCLVPNGVRRRLLVSRTSRAPRTHKKRGGVWYTWRFWYTDYIPNPR